MRCLVLVHARPNDAFEDLRWQGIPWIEVDRATRGSAWRECGREGGNERRAHDAEAALRLRRANAEEEPIVRIVGRRRCARTSRVPRLAGTPCNSDAPTISAQEGAVRIPRSCPRQSFLGVSHPRTANRSLDRALDVDAPLASALTRTPDRDGRSPLCRSWRVLAPALLRLALSEGNGAFFGHEEAIERLAKVASVRPSLAAYQLLGVATSLLGREGSDDFATQATEMAGSRSRANSAVPSASAPSANSYRAR